MPTSNMPADEAAALSRTSLRNAISNAMARITRDFYGKGPSRTRTFMLDRIVFAILDDVLTPVELALKKGGRHALVRRTRLTFEDIMTKAFTGEIEKLTGARVLAYHSQIVFDPDKAIEIFVLDRPAYDATAPVSGADVQSARLKKYAVGSATGTWTAPRELAVRMANAAAARRRIEQARRIAVAGAVLVEGWVQVDRHAHPERRRCRAERCDPHTRADPRFPGGPLMR